MQREELPGLRQDRPSVIKFASTNYPTIQPTEPTDNSQPTDISKLTCVKISVIKPPLTFSEKQEQIQRQNKRKMANAIVNEYVKKQKLSEEKSTRNSKYSDDIIKFAMTLQGYSTKAYNFVRETFDKCLPGKSTIYRYLSKLDVKEGFQESTLYLLKEKSNCYREKNVNLFVSLSIDDISIRQHLQVVGTKVYGLVDEEHLNFKGEVTDALTIMATTLNAAFKVPIAFFFINKHMSSEERASIMIKAIDHVNQTGAVITNITCDNPPSNLKMLKHLGASLDPENLDPRLKFKNVLDKYILAMPDTPHLLKLTRSALGDCEVLVDGDGNQIKWDYIRQLHILQTSSEFHFANMLRKHHIEYWKNRMNVRFAAQVLSRRTANSLMFACQDLKLLHFKNAEATSDFLMCFNNLFDILNSRHPLQSFGKAPISDKNESYWRPELFKCASYISSLKHTSGVSVLRGRRQAAFIGWLLNIEALPILYKEYVASNMLKYLLTYKLSQDPLETFFSSVRACLGANNNPTCLQFIAAVKRLIAGSVNKSDFGNCIWDDSISLLVHHQTLQPAIEETTDEYDLEENLSIELREKAF